MQGCPFNDTPDGGLNGLTEPVKPAKVSPPAPIVALYAAAVRVVTVAGSDLTDRFPCAVTPAVASLERQALWGQAVATDRSGQRF